MFYCEVVNRNFAKGVPKRFRRTTFLTYNKINSRKKWKTS